MGANGVKYREGKLSDDQRKYIVWLEDGGIATIVTSSVEDLITRMDAIDKALKPLADQIRAAVMGQQDGIGSRPWDF